jgi:putative PEP-CTERM system TPR-repeat lipoprotein
MSNRVGKASVSSRFHALLVSAALAAGCTGWGADESFAAAKDHIARNDAPAAIIELKDTLQAQPDFAKARFLLGKLLLAREDPGGAAIELSKASSLNHPLDLVMPLLATAYRQSGQASKVVELDAVSTPASPAAPDSLKTQLAHARADLGQGHDKIEAALSQALQADAHYAPALLLPARLLMSRRDNAGALRVIDDVIQRAPDNAEALSLKADALGVSDSAAATALYQQALACSMRHLAAHAGLVNRALAAGDSGAARTYFEAMRKARPGHPHIRYLEARRALHTGDVKVAGEISQQLLKIAPDNPETLYLAATVALQQGELALAEQHAGKLTRVAPGLADSRRSLAAIHLRGGEPAKALESVRTLIETGTPDFDALTFAGAVYMSMGEPKRAEEAFARAAKVKPDDVNNNVVLALARIARGETAAGLSELQSTAGADAGTAADLALIDAQVRQRNYAAALKAVDALKKKQPGKVQPTYLEGEVRFRMGDAAAARAGFERSLAVEADYFPAIDGLTALDLRDNKPEQARERIQDLLKRKPDQTRALVALAVLEERAGRSEQEVAATLAKAVAVKPDDALLQRTLVKYHLDKKDHALALEAAQRAVTALPYDIDLQLLLGRVQRAGGDTAQAIAAYEKAAAARPGSPVPLMALAEAQLAARSSDAAAEAVKKAQGLAADATALVGMGAKIDVLAGRHDEALVKARALQARSPKSAHGWVLEGGIEMSRRNGPAAAAALQEASDREEPSLVAQRAYLALRQVGDKTTMAAFAADWLKRHRNDATFLFALASWAIEDKDYELAVVRLAQSLRIVPDLPAALNNLAWERAAQKTPGAVAPAERANEITPNRAPFLDTLAFALAAEGNLARALVVKERALELSPAAHGLRLNLARLYLDAGDKSSARRELDTLSALGSAFGRQSGVEALRSKL